MPIPFGLELELAETAPALAADARRIVLLHIVFLQEREVLLPPDRMADFAAQGHDLVAGGDALREANLSKVGKMAVNLALLPVQLRQAPGQNRGTFGPVTLPKHQCGRRQRRDPDAPDWCARCFRSVEGRLVLLVLEEFTDFVADVDALLFSHGRSADATHDQHREEKSDHDDQFVHFNAPPKREFFVAVRNRFKVLDSPVG